MELRPYQQRALDNIHQEFKSVNSTLLVHATGLGKTVIFSHLAKEYKEKGRIMVLAHMEELVGQAWRKLDRVTGESPDTEMGEWSSNEWGAYKSNIVVGTIQTQISRRGDERRMHKFDPNEFSLLIIDECFVPGTLVDGKKIENIKVGDYIDSYNHNLNRLEKKKVTHCFKNHTKILVKMNLSNGQALYCTPNHPIWSIEKNNYIPAILFDIGSMMLYNRHHEETIYKNELQKLRHRSYLRRSQGQRIRSERKGLLFKGVQQGIQCESKFRNHVQNKSKVCVRTNETQQSNEQSRSKSKSISNSNNYEAQTNNTGGQWSWPYIGRKNACIGFGLENELYPKNKDEKRERLSISLQTGFSECFCKDSNRDRRSFSFESENKGSRQKEREFFEITRVESIEILKSGSTAEFESVCPNGFVYNLEIEENNNYFADGILAHNCHHAASPSYRKVIDYYRQNKNIKILGATATPDRADEKALGEIFESVADEYEIVDAIGDGWLVPIYARPVEVEGLDYSQVRTTAGDLNGADLSKVLEYEEILHKFAWPIIDFSGDKKTLVFTASVAQAERLCEILNRHKPNSAQWVHGGTPKEQRRELWPAYAKGEFQYLVNCGITIEGWDEPGVQVVAIARPTKSRSRYAQMIGRGTRPLDMLVDDCIGSESRKLAIASSIKPHIDILDFVGNSGRHKLVTPADILGGRYEDIEVDGRLVSITERAQQNAIQKAAETGQSVNIEDELDNAQKQLIKEAKESAEKKRREHIKLRAKYSTGIINPFAVFDIQPWREREWNKGRQPTDKQMAFLKQSGVDPAGLSFTHASQIIDQIIKNRTNKLATFKQLKVLQKFKYDTDNVTFKQASEIIDELARNNWKRIG